MHLIQVTFNKNKYPVTSCYPYNLELIKQIKEIEFKTPVTFFVGENGCGKTTLLRAIAKSCGIYIWEYSERLRYQNNQYEDRLHENLDLNWESVVVPGHYFDSRNFEYFTKLLDEWAFADPGQLEYFGGRSLVSQSHGQSLMSFFRSRYKIKGIYFLDEPETALSPNTQIELLKQLSKMNAEGQAQFIIATHSPILLALPGATIYSFDNSSIKTIRYEETSHFNVYKDFINNREKYLTDIKSIE